MLKLCQYCHRQFNAAPDDVTCAKPECQRARKSQLQRERRRAEAAPEETQAMKFKLRSGETVILVEGESLATRERHTQSKPWPAILELDAGLSCALYSRRHGDAERVPVLRIRPA